MWSRIYIVLFILSIIIISLILNFNLTPQCLHDFIVDTKFNIPIEHRTPKLKFEDFMNQRETLRHEQMVKTRTMFPKQDYEGNIMMGGYHSLLPTNAKWVNHIISFS